MPSSFSAPGFADELTPGALIRLNLAVETEFKLARVETRVGPNTSILTRLPAVIAQR